MASRKPRIIVYSKATAVLSEKTERRTVRHRGLALECGHSTSRTRPRNKPAPEVGKKLRCETCTKAAEREATRASA